ncbi:MAG: VTT domain-containing protein [Thermoanaerobaculia bacterium]|nr:VTT domain-containing protein [Thermoanaerobaculia bacterium]
MRLYSLLAAGIALAALALFGVVEALELPLLTDPGPWMGGGAMAAAVGFGLLVGDVLLPVPASLVMVAHGALFGVLGGAALSLAGSLGAALFGFWLGRRGSRWVARVVPAAERARADRLMARWGGVAVVATRPLPIVAETVAIVAGTTGMRWGRLAGAAVAGALPASLLYAVAGATATRLDSFLLVFALVLAVAGLFWWLGRGLGRDRGPAGDPAA